MDYDLIVIGGGPAGIIVATNAKLRHPEKKVLLVKSVGKGVVPCAIPYMFKTMDDPEKNRLGDAALEKNGVAIEVTEVVALDRGRRAITTAEGETFTYERLVLATGSEPATPPVDGVGKKGVYAIRKDFDYLKALRTEIERATDIVIIGGGFIGLEVADELTRFPEKKVTVVEFLPRVLAGSFDPEFAAAAMAELTKRGVTILAGTKVVRIRGGERVEAAELSDKQIIPCQLVLLGAGARPLTGLAEKAGLAVDKGIVVDERQRTADERVFAIGDCAAKKDLFTGKSAPVMLASTATAEARIAAGNLFAEGTRNRGTIAAYSTKIGDLVLGAAGMTEERAREEGFKILVGKAIGPDKHPSCLAGMKEQQTKLVFSKETGLLLGGQVTGGDSVGELVNVIALAIQKGTKLTELETLQVATHPKLTAAPTTYPLVVAAQDAHKPSSL